MLLFAVYPSRSCPRIRLEIFLYTGATSHLYLSTIFYIYWICNTANTYVYTNIENQFNVNKLVLRLDQSSLTLIVDGDEKMLAKKSLQVIHTAFDIWRAA